MKNQKWNELTIETFDESLVSEWLANTYKSNTWTKFYRLLEEYGTIGELYLAGPWEWVENPSIGLKAVNLITHVINDLTGTNAIPFFNDTNQINAIGKYFQVLSNCDTHLIMAYIVKNYDLAPKKGKKK